MDKIQSFKDLIVWQEGHKLVVMIYTATKSFPKAETYGLVSQMQRCVVSITSNIAEGFSRQSSKEKNQFFSTARGSLTELENQLLIAKDINYITNSDFDSLNNQLLSVHRLLNAFIAKTKTFMPHSKFHIPNSHPGFTLIELLVVVFIITTISSISIANFRNGEKQRGAALASDTVISAVRTAQNYALTGKKTNNANGACRSAEYFWIQFAYATPTVMILSAQNTCGTVDLMETYVLPANAQIQASGLVLNGSAAVTDLSILFYPPFGTLEAVIDNGPNPGSFTTATITVETLEGDVSKTITVDGVAGRIGE